MTRTAIRPLTAGLIAIFCLALSGCSLNAASADPPAAVGPSPGADASTAEDLKVGDCLNDAELSGIVTSVPVVSCEEPHDSEAYAEFDLDEGPYPGSDAIVARGDAGCVEAFAAFVGIPRNESHLAYSYYQPTESSWPQGDRRILCEIFDPTSQTTGTLKGAAR